MRPILATLIAALLLVWTVLLALLFAFAVNR